MPVLLKVIAQNGRPADLVVQALVSIDGLPYTATSTPASLEDRIGNIERFIQEFVIASMSPSVPPSVPPSPEPQPETKEL